MGIAIAQEVGLDCIRLTNNSAQYLLDVIMCRPDAAERLECWLRGEDDPDGAEAPACISALKWGCKEYLDGYLPVITEEDLTLLLLGKEHLGMDVYPGTGNKALFEALDLEFPSEEDMKKGRLPTGHRRVGIMDCGSGVFPLHSKMVDSLIESLKKGGIGRVLIEHCEDAELTGKDGE